MGGEDRSICIAGCFNKFIEKLQGVHVDCTVNFINTGLASAKLPCVVERQALAYLKTLAIQKNVAEPTYLSQLIETIKKEMCVEVIWDKIEKSVAEEMFSEFGVLYTDPEDENFVKLIEQGKYTKLGKVDEFQKTIQDSTEYQGYISRLLTENIGSFPTCSSLDSVTTSLYEFPYSHGPLDHNSGKRNEFP